MKTDFAEDLLRAQHTFVPVTHALPVLHGHVHAAFEQFCLLPADVRALYTLDLARGEYREAPTKADPDDGFLERAGQKRSRGGTYDHKLMWHFRSDLESVLEDRGLLDFPEVRVLLRTSQDVLDVYRDVLMRVADSLDSHPSLQAYGLGDKLTAHEDDFVLRLIAYQQQRADTEGFVVGQAHQDRSAGTVHGFQSHGSIQVLQHGEWQDAKAPVGHVMFFTAMKLALETGGVLVPEQRCVQGGELPALWHRGCNDASTDLSSEPRKVAVAFCHTDKLTLF